jgi:hypothetical protein
VFPAGQVGFNAGSTLAGQVRGALEARIMRARLTVTGIAFVVFKQSLPHFGTCSAAVRVAAAIGTVAVHGSSAVALSTRAGIRSASATAVTGTPHQRKSQYANDQQAKGFSPHHGFSPIVKC